MAKQASTRVVRFIDANQRGLIRFGLIPESFNSMSKDVTTKLVGQSLEVVEMVEEKQPRYFNISKDLGNRQSTNHVTDCKSLQFTSSGLKAEVGQVLAPIPLDPAPAVWCIGLNYMKHWEEGAKKRGQPLPKIPSSFMKPPSAISGPGQPIWVPNAGTANDRFALGAGSGLNGHVDYEGELAIIIGKACRNLSEEEVLPGGYILGYTAANDVTQRHWQRNSGGDQWGRGKSLDTYCPMGPSLLLAGAQSPDLEISTLVNGEVRQKSRTSDMIFDVSAVVSWLSRATTLVPGTIILTGTPSGVGYAREGGPSWLAEGDDVQVHIENIGCLNNNVINEP